MQCFSPIRIVNPKEPLGPRLTVPCGKCEACVMNKAAEWFARLKIQQRYSENAVFVTLTYDDPHLPPPREDSEGFKHYDVSKYDIRLFHYRLRKNLGSEKSRKLKYFLVSEYGPNPENGWLYRPHYHAIYFNLAPYDYGKLERAWKKGFVEFGEITEGRMRYVSGYCTEKLFVPPGSLPSFAFISNGIGSAYVADFRDYHRGNLDRVFLPLGGSHLPMPRYLKERLYDEDERAYFGDVCKQRAELTRAAHLEAFQGDDIALEDYYSQMRADYVRKLRKKHSKKQN